MYSVLFKDQVIVFKMFAVLEFILLLCVLEVAGKPTEITNVTNITLGLILGDIGAAMHYRIYVPAFEIALENIHADVDAGKLLPVHMSYHLAVTDHDCGRSVMTAPGVAATLYSMYKPDAIFGPNCSPEAAPVADLATYWNIPMLTGSTTAHYLDQKSRYRTFTRLPFKQSTLSNFVVDIFKLYDWTAGAIIVDNSYIYWTFVAPAVTERLRTSDIEVLVIDHSAYPSNKAQHAIEALQNRRGKWRF